MRLTLLCKSPPSAAAALTCLNIFTASLLPGLTSVGSSVCFTQSVQESATDLHALWRRWQPSWSCGLPHSPERHTSCRGLRTELCSRHILPIWCGLIPASLIWCSRLMRAAALVSSYSPARSRGPLTGGLIGSQSVIFHSNRQQMKCLCHMQCCCLLLILEDHTHISPSLLIKSTKKKKKNQCFLHFSLVFRWNFTVFPVSLCEPDSLLEFAHACFLLLCKLGWKWKIDLWRRDWNTVLFNGVSWETSGY